MNEMTKKAALVSLEEWNAIHEKMRKTFTVTEDSPLAPNEFQAAAQQVQPPSAD